ncbi:MAG: hypothetical protein REI12_07570, partial [Pedobacter sp.]|nr:hypothetical protein [Pedobacter sp.]
AQNCKAIADQKLKDQERLAKQQQETNRIVEQQQQALRTEQFNRELERSNAERDAYNQRAQADANRQAAQYQAQQRAQQAAAQAEYQRQQAARQAAAEAEQRRQQEWQQTVDTTTEWVRSSRQSNEMQLANAQAKTQQIETAYGQEDDALARMIAEAKARQERAAQEAKTARTPDVNPSESEDQVQTSSPECAAREQEVKATRIPSNASITASQETVMFLTRTAVEMFDDGCPGISADERRQYQAAYDAAQQGCNQVQSGGRQCVASNHFGPGAKPGEGLRSPDPKIPVGAPQPH